MTLRHMQIFVEVYQQESMTRAADRLRLAQPSVSLAVRELEEHYGLRLFDRLNRRIYPTEGGRLLYGYALHIVALFDEMEARVRNWDGSGTLRVGTSVTIGNYVLPEAAAAFQREFPEMRVEAFVNNSAAIEGALLDNRIDLGLIENDVHRENLLAVPFMEDRLCVIVPPGHPFAQRGEVAPEELSGCDFLMREKGSAGRELMDSFFALRQIELHPLWESSSTQAIVRGVARGLGVAVLPFLLVEQDIAAGRVCRIEVRGLALSRRFHIVYHKNKYQTAAMERFISLCRECGKKKAP